MIVPMKKVFVMMQEKEARAGLEALRDLGLVHTEHSEPPVSRDVEAGREQWGRVKDMISVLSQLPRQGVIQEKISDWLKTLEALEVLLSEKEALEERIEKKCQVISQWKPWGSFDPQDIKFLQAHGVFVRFVEVPATGKTIEQDIEGVVLVPVFIRAGTAGCLALSREAVKLPFPELPLLPRSVGELEKALQEARQRVGHIDKEIARGVCYLEEFHRVQKQLEHALRFHETFAGKGLAEKIVYYKGFCPEPSAPQLEEYAQTHQWGLLWEDPSDDDQVPTLLKNPRWVEMVKPIFDVTHILPGYHELDTSAVFLTFFSVFFGILIGDAAYGLLFMLTAFWVKRQWGHRIADKNIFRLLYLLSSSAIIWGVLTGTFFGQEWMRAAGWQMGLPWLKDNHHVQLVCFVIGAVQLSLAHLWRAVLKMPSPAFLGDVGWALLVWGMFFAATMLVLEMPFPEIGKILFAGGVALIILFSYPQRNVFKGILRGLMDFLMKGVNAFTDIVSYIRLFAVGLASVAVADAFNAMALSLGFHSVVRTFFAALILVVGHLFNLALGTLAIFVHGLRLNVLEFSGHLNLEWTGFKYDPLRREEKGD